MITGVSISAAVATTLTGGPLVLAYSLAFGTLQTTLAGVTDTASFTFVATPLRNTKRVPIGINACVAAAAAGVQMNDIVRKLDTPILVCPGEFLSIAMKNLGVVTSAGSIAISVTFDGYWE
jgi:hypothetical protein